MAAERSSMDSKQHAYKILMLPWLAHGHLSPFFELAKKLAHRNFQVYICSTPVNLNPIRESHARNPLITSNSIQFVDIQLPPTTPELPQEYHTTKNLPPHLMPVLKTAFDESKENFREILRLIKPDLVIYDFVQPWAPAIAHEEEIKSVVFITFGAAAIAFLFHSTEHPGVPYPTPQFNFPNNEIRKIVQFLHQVSNGLTDLERALECIKRSSGFVLVKTSNEIEQKHIDYFSKLTRKEVIPVGPLVQLPENKSSDSVFMEWLSKRAPSSVVLVSFGTEYFLSKKETETIACGLELSKVSFIWVVRFHGSEKISLHEVLPEGFHNTVAERGMVVEGWAPQAKILSHPSTGGFVTHCGWNSTLESITFGVPIIAMPMQLDQPGNARLAVDIGVAIEVQKESDNFEREEIARVIREVVLQEEGKEMRMKIQKLSEKLKEKGDQEMDYVVKKLMQLVKQT